MTVHRGKFLVNKTNRHTETCRVVIPMNLEFSVSVGFIHKEFIDMVYLL